MNPQVDDQMLLLSDQYYPSHQAQLYTHFVPEQGVVAGVKSKAVRRRRKKKKGDDDEEEGNMMMRKRKLSEEQVNMLEKSFENEHKLESERKDRLAAELGLDPRQVAVWFQNRRARWKTKKLEDEYSKLKSHQETTVLEKCRLETELLKLKEQLHEAEKEIQKLSERLDGFSSNSPRSSFSLEPMEPLFLGEFGMDGLENVLYVQDQNNYVNGLEWDNLYII
ncbi:hypothetical protein BUALT_Bualt11G0053100 [Buddleja alternifolia]|uniref:Homeobox-leucine zipper protein n=1 Tax=Buddleja alternifolia TaxID=168488 RepID=A0AAV6WZZ6_9LAMI|nr:hypothetical protein BUALT_Bualt11G0053100 [Buddleja alternifolia]